METDVIALSYLHPYSILPPIIHLRASPSLQDLNPLLCCNSLADKMTPLTSHTPCESVRKAVSCYLRATSIVPAPLPDSDLQISSHHNSCKLRSCIPTGKLHGPASRTGRVTWRAFLRYNLLLLFLNLCPSSPHSCIRFVCPRLPGFCEASREFAGCLICDPQCAPHRLFDEA